MIRSPLAIVAVAGLIAAGAMGVVVARDDGAPATTSTQNAGATESADDRVAELVDDGETLALTETGLREDLRDTQRRVASLRREIARQERRIRRLEAELASLG